jgi:bifunctional enzyme CysN/CysC
VENIRRIGEVARLMADAGLIATCSFISPFQAERQMARELVGTDRFFEIFVDAPIELCIARDPKGLYAKAKAGEIRNFTGFDSPYEVPQAPDLVIQAAEESVEVAVERIVAALRARGIIA